MNRIFFGCYIIEPVSKPKHLGLECDQVLTASSCIGDLHPSLEGTFWLNKEREQKLYQKHLGLTAEEFTRMKARVAKLFEKQRLDVDGRFLDGDEACAFAQEYLYRLPEARVIALEIDRVHGNALKDEMKDVANIPWAFKEGGVAASRCRGQWSFLGWDILGWDFGGFHSYLCNELNREISERYRLELSELGLIQNSRDQVERFCRLIKGRGEPVEWLPFAMYECEYKKMV